MFKSGYDKFEWDFTCLKRLLKKAFKKLKIFKAYAFKCFCMKKAFKFFSWKTFKNFLLEKKLSEHFN